MSLVQLSLTLGALFWIDFGYLTIRTPLSHTFVCPYPVWPFRFYAVTYDTRTSSKRREAPMQQFAMKEKDVKKKYGWMMPYPSSISKFSSPHPLTHRPTVREETRQSKPKIQYCSNIQQSLVAVLSQKEEEARSVRLIDSNQIKSI